MRTLETDFDDLVIDAELAGYDVIDRTGFEVLTIKVPARTRLVYGLYDSASLYGWKWIRNSNNYDCLFDSQKQTLTKIDNNSNTTITSLSDGLKAIGYDDFEYPLWTGDGSESCAKPKCDCGAAKCNTTHASWCSIKL